MRFVRHCCERVRQSYTAVFYAYSTLRRDYWYSQTSDWYRAVVWDPLVMLLSDPCFHAHIHPNVMSHSLEMLKIRIVSIRLRVQPMQQCSYEKCMRCVKDFKSVCSVVESSELNIYEGKRVGEADIDVVTALSNRPG